MALEKEFLADATNIATKQITTTLNTLERIVKTNLRPPGQKENMSRTCSTLSETSEQGTVLVLDYTGLDIPAVHITVQPDKR